jgi:hypothetical protein
MAGAHGPPVPGTLGNRNGMACAGGEGETELF